MPSTSLRASRLTTVAAASGAINWLNRASWRLFDAAGNLSPLVTSTRTGTATFFDSTGTLQNAAANTPRVSFDPANLSLGRFLLAEEARTNSIRNNTMQGAVAGVVGAGGSLGTNWSTSALPVGITASVLGVFTINGIPRVRVRFSGTATSSANVRVDPDTLSAVTASNGQTWVGSWYLSVAPASAAVSIPLNVRVMGRDNADAGYNISTTPVTVTTTTQRVSATTTMANAAITRATTDVLFTFSAGVAQDFTIDIGLPQLEQAATANSPILTYGTAVTRSADNLSVTNLAATGFNASGNTLYCDYQHDTASSSPVVVALNNGTVQNRIVVVASTSTGIRGAIVNANTTQADMSVSNYSANTRNRAALAFATDNFAFVTTGNGLQRDTLGTVPTVTQLEIGRQTGGLNVMNGRIYQAAIIPTRVPDSGLTRLTRS